MSPDTYIAITHFYARRCVYEGLEEAFHNAKGAKELRALYMRTLHSLSPCLKMPEPYAFVCAQGEAAPFMIAALAVDELIAEKLKELWPNGDQKA